ncbi:MAG: PfkB family carbohydrate kinase [SAR202 cluster bacterium]|nr:PfkB family carbohydrate kinase [SAR202 cluster bacterium]
MNVFKGLCIRFLMFDIVGIGCSCYDFLGISSVSPNIDGKIRLDRAVSDGGGMVATALVAASRLGASVAYLGPIPGDNIGGLIKKSFDIEGVDIQYCKFDPNAKSHISMVMVDTRTGGRTIYSSGSREEYFMPEDLQNDVIQNARFLLIDGTYRAATIKACNIAKEFGLTIVLDADDRLANDPDVYDLMGLVDIIIPSNRFITRLTNETVAEKAIAKLKESISSSIVLTLGGNGCIISDGNSFFRIPAFKVDVLDTTGAGDVFHGAILVGLMHEWDLIQSAKFASAVAALSCTKLGGRSGIPTFGETMDFLTDHGVKNE